MKGFTKDHGETERVGTGQFYPYSIWVEDEIPLTPRAFARQVFSILSDKRGWIRGGKVSFQQVDQWENTQCYLALPDTVDQLCAPLDTAGEVSCQVGTTVVINYERWMKSVPHWAPGRIRTYRAMVINHEFGHRIGKGHKYCADSGGKKAPVMQQQTYGLQGCERNSWPLPSEL